MMYEMNRMLPLFLASNSEELIKREIERNEVLMVNSIMSRKRYVAELKKRFKAVPESFWNDYRTWNEPAQRLGIFYVLLTSYRILLDFHLNVALKQWKSTDRRISKDDVSMELAQIASNDEFVDSWSDNTKDRVVSAYLTFLNQAGVYDKNTFELHQANGVSDNDYYYYVNIGQGWFLEACLLFPYEIDKVKGAAL